MHQIWADKYTQETVIEEDHSLPFHYAIFSDSELIFLFCWQNFVAKLIYFQTVMPLIFGILEEIIEKNYRKPIYRHLSN